MKNYLELGRQILAKGAQHPDRTGEGRISIYGTQLKFDLADGFPLVTTKKTHLRGIVEELIWFLRGSTDNKELQEKKVSIWDEWAVRPEDVDSLIVKLQAANAQAGFAPYDDNSVQELREQMLTEVGSIGNLYGRAWRAAPNHMPPNPLQTGRQGYDRMLSDKQERVRDLLASSGLTVDTANEANLQNAVLSIAGEGVDQLGDAIWTLKNNPYSSRICISAWIPEWVPFDGVSPQHNALLGRGALAACHCFYQFTVTPPATPEGRKKLNCISTVRSWDFALGAPYNIASYAALTMMLAQVLDMDAGELTVNGGDTHFYPKHVKTFQEVQSLREPRPLPRLLLNPDVKDILAFKWEDFILEGYDPHDRLDYEISI